MSIDKYYEEQGSGSPIIFIHGSYASTSSWRKMVEELAKDYRCISIKLPGHGGAPEAQDFAAPSVDTELAIVERVVRELTDEPIHLVGHSYGGVVALAQALRGSLSLSQLTLYEPVAFWALEEGGELDSQIQAFLSKYRHSVSQNVPDVSGHLIDFWVGDGAFEQLPDFIKEGMQTLVPNNIRHWDVCVSIDASLADLKTLDVPTRVVCGTDSNPLLRAISDAVGGGIPTSRNYVIDGASHFLVTSHVDECLSALKDTSVLAA